MSNYRRLFIPNAYVFLTITTNYRREILINNIELLRESFKRAMMTYKFDLFACVILPEHMHLLIKPENINDYPKIIFAMKYHFSRNVDSGGLGNPPYGLSESKQRKKEKGIWQRRFIEHTIRDEKDLYNHLHYIHYNPVKHGFAKNVKDWEYSSFQKFVEMKWYEADWGSAKDIKGFEDLKVAGDY